MKLSLESKLEISFFRFEDDVDRRRRDATSVAWKEVDPLARVEVPLDLSSGDDLGSRPAADDVLWVASQVPVHPKSYTWKVETN